MELNSTASETGKSIGDIPIEFERLIILTGPMMGGKTSELIRMLRVTSEYRKCIAINTVKDDRFGETGIIAHSKESYPSVRVKSLEDVFVVEEFAKSGTVAIDEAQFFPDLVPFVIKVLKETNKTIYVAGLIGDSDQRTFGDIHKLFPLASDIKFLKGACKICSNGTPSAYSRHIGKKESQEEIGGNDKYMSVCFNHRLPVNETWGKKP